MSYGTYPIHQRIPRSLPSAVIVKREADVQVSTHLTRVETLIEMAAGLLHIAGIRSAYADDPNCATRIDAALDALGIEVEPTKRTTKKGRGHDDRG
jgi:hypothetical protein